MGRIYEPHLLKAPSKGFWMGRLRLIRAGAQGVNIATASGRTAMIVAAAFGYAQLLKKLLLANRDNPGVPTTAMPWTSPLLVACDAGHLCEDSAGTVGARRRPLSGSKTLLCSLSLYQIPSRAPQRAHLKAPRRGEAPYRCCGEPRHCLS